MFHLLIGSDTARLEHLEYSPYSVIFQCEYGKFPEDLGRETNIPGRTTLKKTDFSLRLSED